MTESPPVLVAAAQLPACGEDAEANIASALEAVRTAAAEGVKFIVLPELATTPYFCVAAPGPYVDWAQPVNGSLTTRFADVAAELDVVVILPFYELDVEAVTFHNSIVVVGPTGVLAAKDRNGLTHATTRKLHLPAGPDGDERAHFTPGDALGVYEHGGLVFGALVCYDRRFPECWRELRSLGAAVVFVPIAGEGGDGTDFFICELRTHARENGVVAVTANKTGIEWVQGTPVRNFGESSIITAEGTVVAQRGDEAGPGLVIAEIDLTEIGEVRRRFPYFEHRRRDLAFVNDPDGERPSSAPTAAAHAP